MSAHADTIGGMRGSVLGARLDEARADLKLQLPGCIEGARVTLEVGSALGRNWKSRRAASTVRARP